MKKVFLKFLQKSEKNKKHLCWSLAFIMFLRFLLPTLSMYLFAENGREKQLLLFESLKYLTQQTNTLTKLATVTLKQDAKFVKS